MFFSLLSRSVCYFSYNKILSFLCFLILFSCNQNTFKTDEDLMNYLREEVNGYTQSKTINGVDFILSYRPTDLLVNQELGGSTSSSKIDSLRSKYNKYLYFNLSMSKNNEELLNGLVKNQNRFGSMVNQLAFRMGEKVHLYTQNKDTIEIFDFIYPRMYGMSRSTTIMFVFPRENKKLQQENLSFVIEDLGFYTGEIKFKVETVKINKEPKLLF